MRATRRAYDGVLSALDGPTLHALACLADDLRRPRFLDPKLAAEELAATGQEMPGLGWWRRHLGITSEHRLQAADVPQRRENEGATMTTTTNTGTRPRCTTQTGNITRDPELRFGAKGTPWCTTGLAVNRRRRLDDGNYEELATEFYELVTFGDLAEHVAESLSKGDRVIAWGRTEEDSWTAKDGTERTTTKLVADDVGPSLRYATCEAHRTRREGPAERRQDDGYDDEPF